MNQIFTEEEIRHLYADKQKEDFPRARVIVGILYGILFIAGGIGAYTLLFWVAIKLFNV